MFSVENMIGISHFNEGWNSLALQNRASIKYLPKEQQASRLHEKQDIIKWKTMNKLLF